MSSSLLCLILHPTSLSSTRHVCSRKECPTVSLAQALPRTILLLPNYFYLDFSILTSFHIVSVCVCMHECVLYVHVCGYAGMCNVCACKDKGGCQDSILSLSALFPWDSLLLKLERGWYAVSPRNSPTYALNSAVLACPHAAMPSFSYGCWEFELSPLHLNSKCSYLLRHLPSLYLIL